jgi:hypothetical protein
MVEPKKAGGWNSSLLVRVRHSFKSWINGESSFDIAFIIAKQSASGEADRRRHGPRHHLLVPKSEVGSCFQGFE